MNIEEHKLFSHTIFSSELKIPENAVEEIHKLMKQPSVEVSNRGGWQSKLYFNDEIEWMKPVLEEMWKGAHHFTELYGGKKENIQNCCYWFNVNGKGDFNQIHNHPGSMISACMYIKVPKEKNAGELVFDNPFQDAMNWAHFFSLPGNAQLTDYNYPNWYVVPEEGKVVFFPSYLRHHVEPNENDDERISIAFNFSF